MGTKRLYLDYNLIKYEAYPDELEENPVIRDPIKKLLSTYDLIYSGEIKIAYRKKENNVELIVKSGKLEKILSTHPSDLNTEIEIIDFEEKVAILKIDGVSYYIQTTPKEK